MANKGRELKDALNFHVELAEERLLQILGKVVDTTKIKRQQLAECAAAENLWNAGKITSPGTPTCTNCGHSLIFHMTHEIPACSECGGTLFQRQG